MNNEKRTRSCAIRAAAMLLALAPLASLGAPSVTIADETTSVPRAITVDDMIALRRVDAFGLSPDRRRFAILVRRADPRTNEYRTGWFVGSVQGGALTYVGDGGRAWLRVAPNGRITGPIEAREVRWSADGQWIAYTLRRDGEVQLWRSKYDGSVQEQLTHNPADVRAFTWSDDGRTLYFNVGTPRAELQARAAAKDREGYRYDEDLSFFVDFMLPQHIRRPETALAVWRIDPGAQQERVGDEADRAAFERARLRDAGGRETPFGAVLDAVIPPVLRADGARVWLARSGSSSVILRVVAALSAAGTAATPCAAAECSGTIKKVWWSEDGKRVLFWRTEGVGDATEAVYSWIPPRPSVSVVWRGRDDALETCEQAAGDRLLCARSTSTRPVHMASIDLRSGQVREVAEINPEFRSIRLGKVERFEWDTPQFPWSAPGGQLEGLYPARAFGYIIYPPDFDPRKKYPVFIEPYAAFGFDVPTLHGEQPLHVYAANGFVVLNTQFPVDTGYIDRLQRYGAAGPKLIYSAELGFPHLTMLMESTVRALDTTAARGFIDEQRVGIGGVSHGSFVPMYMMQKYNRLAALSISSPGWDPAEYYVATQAGRQLIAAAGGEDWQVDPEAPGGREFWRQINIADHIDAIEAPILMNLSAHETYAAARLIRELADAGLAYDAYVYPQETHIKWQPAHLQAIMVRNVDWFRFWLQNVEDGDPAKAEQYRRWRELRDSQAARRSSIAGARSPRPGN
jgi:dipeptidyl aminopeptidase/acylaminoacyl peptidase